MHDPHLPVIKVLGLGGGGCNAVNRMLELGLQGPEFIAANTDAQALRLSLAPIKLQLGPQSTRGLGAGGDPRVGYRAAEESADDLRRLLAGADIVFLAAGLGGGTGTGSLPVAARIARELGAIVVAVVTLPFSFEIGKRQQNARWGLEQLRPHVHTLIAIPNDRLLKVAPERLPMEMAFRMADDVLRQAIQGVTELITQPGLVNLDFSHLKRLLAEGGGAVFTIGQGKGEDKMRQALHNALHHPLLEDISLAHASGLLVNFTAGPDLSLMEIGNALQALHAQLPDEHSLVWGLTTLETFTNRVQVIMVIAGVGGHEVALPEMAQPREDKDAAPAAATAYDLSLPAFLRHRPRHAR